MVASLRPTLVLLALFSLLTGVVYPGVVTGIAQAAFHEQANGSLIRVDGRVVGSELIGQAFSDPRYFWGRPSATSPFGYNGASSSGSNLGPSSPALAEAVKARVDALRNADPDNRDPVPIDLVTASASGLDPHISPAAALFQAGRVARARGLTEERVRALVHRQIESPALGLIGEPRVHVLRLNLALDRMAGPGG